MSDMESDFEAATKPIGSRKIRPSGGSLVVTIPPAALFQSGLSEDDDVKISVLADGKILLERESGD